MTHDDARTRGGGFIQGAKQLCGCARKIILANNLLHQAEAQSRVPVRFSVPQGTGETISEYHRVVQPHEWYCNPDVDPTMYVWKGFLDVFLPWVASNLLLLTTSQELFHWLLPVGVRVRVSKYDVDYGASLDFSILFSFKQLGKLLLCNTFISYVHNSKGI